MSVTLPPISGKVGQVMLCFPLDSERTEMCAKKKQVCGGWKDIGKQANLNKLANIITILLDTVM